jgi:hypothetical protein
MNSSSYNNNGKNKILVPGAEQGVSQMKYEIANEFGVNLGPDATARQNGSVGGEITRRLVSMAQSQLGGK